MHEIITIHGQIRDQSADVWKVSCYDFIKKNITYSLC